MGRTLRSGVDVLGVVAADALDPVFGAALKYYKFLSHNWSVGGIYEHRIFDPDSTRPLNALCSRFPPRLAPGDTARTGRWLSSARTGRCVVRWASSTRTTSSHVRCSDAPRPAGRCQAWYGAARRHFLIASPHLTPGSGTA